MDEIYHVYNRSIGESKVFTNDNEYARFVDEIRFYQIEKPGIKYSDFLDQATHLAGGLDWQKLFIGKERLVEILAYCLMPTHFHLAIKQSQNKDGIANFISNLLNSYTRYFNIKYKRKGTLWEGRSKRVIMKSNEQFIHLTRYIHLNPVTAYLVDRPEEWPWSSYREYILELSDDKRICNYDSLMDMDRLAYKEFVEDGILYQRERARTKNLNYTSPV